MTRRRVLSLGTLAAGAVVLGVHNAQAAAAASAQIDTCIDVHGHAITPALERLLQSRGSRTLDGRELPTWDVDAALAFLDRRGIDLQVLSTPDPGLSLAPLAEQTAVARALNDDLADIVAQAPTRFGWLAVLPLRAGARAAITECRRAIARGADGVILPTTVDRRQLGDHVFWPLLAELSRRGVRALVHPVPPTQPEQWPEHQGAPVDTLEYAFASVRCAASLLYGGAFLRAPRLRLVFAGCGGGLPFVASRVALPDQALSFELFIRPLRQFSFDTAQSNDPGALAATRAFVRRPTQLLYGSNWPLSPEQAVPEALQHIRPTELGIAAGGAALTRFPTLAARRAPLG